MDMELDMVYNLERPLQLSPDLVQTLKVDTQDRACPVHEPYTFPGPYTVLNYSTDTIYNSPNSSPNLCSTYQ